ncbi:MAG: type II toxin-antitoxin system RelE/ParE family toxin [Gemmatimonadota bacterium]
MIWLSGEVKSPPFSKTTRLETGYLLRRLQKGEKLEMPHSKSINDVCRRCHELRVQDEGVNWRIIYRIDDDAIVIGEVFAKQTTKIPGRVIKTCKRRFRQYDLLAKAD